MSKKKTFTGNTMTLKDFHGGSIPSDLPLPSAPGVVVRSSDRPGYERQSSWGSSVNRAEHRLRPSSSGSMRNLDDKAPFLTSASVGIGRNFDEDERKPLDGGSAVPRRTVSDDGVRGGVAVVRAESRGDGGRGGVGVGSGSSYSARVVEGGSGGARPNAWGVRKEVVEPVSSSSSWGGGQSTVSKFAQASALDQISSGRWQTKPVVHQQADVEVIRQSPNSLYGREGDYYYGGGVGNGAEMEYHETTLVRHAERGLAVEDGFRGGLREMPTVERVRSPVQFDRKERNSVMFTNEGQPVFPEAKYASTDSQVGPEVSGRPKLKLLPRTRPLETPEPSAIDYKQPMDTRRQDTGGNSHGNGIHVKPGLLNSETSHLKPLVSSSEASYVKPVVSSSEAGDRVVERPKLNLKPRSQPLDQGSTDRERVGLFGGARPREMVLKERGVDDVVNSHDEAHGSRRIKNDVPRTEVAPAHTSTLRHVEKVPNVLNDQKSGRGHERKDNRADVQKADMQRKNWRNENWRNGRDTEKHPQQERQPSPETWRKPVEQPKAANADNSGLRFGKAVSAVDLAQAFSRSVSDTKPVDQFSGQRGLPGRVQMPFSRLTGSTSRAQINGY